MFASLSRRTYRLLIRLYPAEFRREYGDDMVLIYEQLVADRGVLVATGRASIDLIVTVPRYRLEAVMTESQATRALTTIIAGLIVMGVSSLAMLGLPLVGAVLILAGVGLALAGRGRLARALRSVPDVSRRGRRLRWSALSAGVFAACVVGYFVVLWDNEVSTPGLLIPTLLAPVALCSAVYFLVAGLLTPRTRTYHGTS